MAIVNFAAQNTESTVILRKKASASEGVIWANLSRGVCGVWFRRRYPIGNHIVDFYCRKLKLIIEISKTGEPKERDLYFRASGYTVLRFSDTDISNRLPHVISSIHSAIRFTKMHLRFAAIIEKIVFFPQIVLSKKIGKKEIRTAYADCYRLSTAH